MTKFPPGIYALANLNILCERLPPCEDIAYNQSEMKLCITTLSENAVAGADLLGRGLRQRLHHRVRERVAGAEPRDHRGGEPLGRRGQRKCEADEQSQREPISGGVHWVTTGRSTTQPSADPVVRRSTFRAPLVTQLALRPPAI